MAGEMIVDTHTLRWDDLEELGPETACALRQQPQGSAAEPDATAEAFDAAMQPVDHAILHGRVGGHDRSCIRAERVAAFIRRDRTRYLGFAGVDPLVDEPRQTLASVQDLGLSGVTVCPAGGGFHPTHSRAMALYEACEKAGLPVFFHTRLATPGPAVMAFSRPYLLDEVAREFPELRIVIGHAGHPWSEEALVLLTRHRHVYAEVSGVASRSWHLYQFALSAYQQGVIGRLLFASHFPFSTPEEVITAIYSINGFAKGTALPAIPRGQLRSIVERDALACLGIPRPTGAAPSRAERAAREAEGEEDEHDEVLEREADEVAASLRKKSE